MLGPWVDIERPANTLIRLGWPESSLGAHRFVGFVVLGLKFIKRHSDSRYFKSGLPGLAGNSTIFHKVHLNATQPFWQHHHNLLSPDKCCFIAQERQKSAPNRLTDAKPPYSIMNTAVCFSKSIKKKWFFFYQFLCSYTVAHRFLTKRTIV